MLYRALGIGVLRLDIFLCCRSAANSYSNCREGSIHGVTILTDRLPRAPFRQVGLGWQWTVSRVSLWPQMPRVNVFALGNLYCIGVLLAAHQKMPACRRELRSSHLSTMATDGPVSGRTVLQELEDASTAVRRKLDILEHFRDVFTSSGVQQSTTDRNAAVPSLCRVSGAFLCFCMSWACKESLEFCMLLIGCTGVQCSSHLAVSAANPELANALAME